MNLHKSHGHGLPITHSATRGWFWNVKPIQDAPVNQHHARSETTKSFPWHTDCSYEHSPPRFFALQVVQHDTCGGGTLSLLKVHHVLNQLSAATRECLSQPEYQINVPPEFVKGDETRIIGKILASGSNDLRFREDIFTPLTPRARLAFQELKSALLSSETAANTLNLSPQILPKGTIVLLNNRQWLHARNEVKDPKRHLRRVRWDANPFDF